jgi:transcriptional regulator with GAF, ATPase, and Fis domain
MGVALQNARLFEEERQRAAELGTINDIGQALVSEPELDALIELVGEKLRETFNAQIIYIALHDRATNLVNFPYYVEDAQRRPEPSFQFGEGLTSRILQSRRPLLLNETLNRDELQAG